MLISQEVNDAMNEQIGHEFGASLQYVAIAAYFEHDNLTVLANRFYTQATEERDHAMRFVKYILDVGRAFQCSYSSQRSVASGCADAHR